MIRIAFENSQRENKIKRHDLFTTNYCSDVYFNIYITIILLIVAYWRHMASQIPINTGCDDGAIITVLTIPMSQS